MEKRSADATMTPLDTAEPAASCVESAMMSSVTGAGSEGPIRRFAWWTTQAINTAIHAPTAVMSTDIPQIRCVAGFYRFRRPAALPAGVTRLTTDRDSASPLRCRAAVNQWECVRKVDPTLGGYHGDDAYRANHLADRLAD